MRRWPGSNRYIPFFNALCATLFFSPLVQMVVTASFLHIMFVKTDYLIIYTLYLYYNLYMQVPVWVVDLLYWLPQFFTPPGFHDICSCPLTLTLNPTHALVNITVHKVDWNRDLKNSYILTLLSSRWLLWEMSALVCWIIWWMQGGDCSDTFEALLETSQYPWDYLLMKGGRFEQPH